MAQILVRATVTTDGYCAGWVGYVDDTDPVVQELVAGGYLTTNVTVLPPPVELCCLPPGGTTNQILAKVSDLDRDANWQNAPPSLPSGPASGVLSGTYPNPIFAEDMATQIELDAAVAGVPEQAQDAAAAMIAAGTHAGISFAYNDAAGTLSATVPAAYTDEQAQDAVAAMIAAGTQTGLTASYNDAAGTLSFTVTGAPPSGTAGGVLTGSYPNPSFAASPAFTGNPTAPTPTAADNDTSVATTAFVQGEIAAKAPLASPAFTGNPTAPTPASGDRDTSIATTAFVATLKQPLNVMDYGAVGDGTADDTAALQAWITAVRGARGYGVSPANKTFRITTTLALASPGTYWLDFGGSTVKKDAAFPTVTYAFEVTGNAQIKNLVLDGNRAAGALGFGLHFSNLNANDVHLEDTRVINNRDTGIVCTAAGVKVTCRNVECSNNSTGVGTGGSDGFRVTAGALLIMDTQCQANDNERAGIFVDSSAHGDCVINGFVRRNLQNGVTISGPSTHGSSQYLYGDDNKNFGLQLINTGGTFLGPSNWNFGHVEMCRTGAAIAGTYTQNNAGTGVEGYGIRNNTFEMVIGRGNLGYDFIMVAGNSADGATNSTRNHVETCYATNLGPTGLPAADTDPAIVLGGSSSYNTFGTVTCHGKSFGLLMGEAPPTNNDYNTFGSVTVENTGWSALFILGAYNYFGQVVTRNTAMNNPGTYPAVVTFYNDAATHDNLVDRLDHQASGTAYSYLASFQAAATNNQVTRARGAFATALKLDTGTGNTVTAG